MLKKLFKFIKRNPLLILIVILGIGLRIVAVAEMPPSLNWDEVSHGYNAYSILKTGKDEWGAKFPIIFRAYGDYKLPVYIYLTAVLEFFLGVNEFSVRFLSMLAGVVTIIFTYFLTKKILKNKKIALLSSLLVAVEPWSLFLSRGAFEANLALTFTVSGVYFFLVGLEKKRNLLASMILFGLSVWTYNSARIFVPFLIVVLFLLFKKELLHRLKRSKVFTLCLFVFMFLFFVLMFLQLATTKGQARYGKVAIIDSGAIAQIIEAREKSSYSPLLTRLIYNRPVYFISHFSENWISHFTPSFLFLQGGSHFQFSVPDHGVLYLIDLPFFFLGLVILLNKVFKKDKLALFLLSWLVLSPIASSLTREAPHVLRSITILPLPMIISSIGIVKLYDLIGNKFRISNFELRKIIIFLYVLVLFGSTENYLNAYFIDYKENYSWSWQYGYKQIAGFVKENYNSYDKIIITKKYGEPHEFILFYWPWNPESYRKDKNLKRFYQSNWYWVDSFDKFYFVNDWNIPKEEWQDFSLESGDKFNCRSKNCLLVTSPNNVPKGWRKIKSVNFLNGETAYELYEN